MLSELAPHLCGPETLFILCALESLPSPPGDPVPIVLQDLIDDLRSELRQRELSTQDSSRLAGDDASFSDFKRAFQVTLRKLARSDIKVVLTLDEIEYHTPSDRIGVSGSDTASDAQLLGRSLDEPTPVLQLI
ncbi:hypothetical protein ACWDKQ_16200 [Saccharopolyspora sp. NPDC000995]